MNGKPTNGSHRDPESGQIVPSTYRWPWLGDLMRVWPVLVFLMGVVTAGVLDRIAHEVEHAAIDHFMVGERFSKEDGKDLKAEMIEEIHGLPRPPQDFRAEFDALTRRVASIEQSQNEHIGEFREFRGEITANIQQLLND